jgi:N-acyl-D-amino-acid deacylase
MKRTFLLRLLVLLSIPFLAASSVATRQEYDIAIINGRIVDGTGNPWFYGSVAIKDGRIVKVGAVDAQRAGRVIDASGLIVAPGFIDVHTHVEGSLGENPLADNFTHMGVTSVITGNCGSSSLQVADFLSKLESKGVALNVGTLVGHGSVRREVLKDEDREPAGPELERMKLIVERAMREGAVGMSTGLIYVPGTYAKTGEIVELARVVAKYGGIYATHMRDEGNNVTESIAEALLIGEQAKLPVEISHFKVSSKKRWGDSSITCKMVSDARAQGRQVTVDQYVYVASATSLNTMLPSWALEGGKDKARKRLSDPDLRARIKREMIESINKSGFADFSYAVVSSFQPDHSFEGKPISTIAKAVRGKDTLDDQAEQVIDMYLAGSAGMIFHKMAESDVERIVAQPFAMIASDSGVIRLDDGSPHPRGYGNNARVLATYVRQKRVISLEDAVRKMTSLPAATFKLWDRGLIRAGMAADVVVFDADKVGDRATFDKPHQYSEGFAYVLVNGKPVIDGGKQTGATPGRALFGPGKSESDAAETR